MKTSVIASSGLAVAVLLGLSTAGCKITRYGDPTGKLAPNEEAVCRATCEHLIERQAISLDDAKECLASCGAHPSAKAAKKAPEKASAEAESRPETASAEVESRPEAASVELESRPETATVVVVDARCRKTPAPRSAKPPAAPRPPTPPAAPASTDAECQSDSDCPDDTSCKHGVCR